MKKTSILSKSLILMILLFIGSAPLMAQISEGEPYSRTIRTGNRPSSGDWGIFIGPSLFEIEQMLDKDVSWRGLPLVNFKRYRSDNIEIRCGIQLSNTKSKQNGEMITNEGNGDVQTSVKDQESFYRLTPGIAYHFSSKNLLDVYIGANLPLGLSLEKHINVYDGDNVGTKTRSSFEIGLGTYIGLQCFVADLPVAIGLEYGLTFYKYFGQKYKNIDIDEDGREQTYYTVDSYSPIQYSSLKSSQGYIGSDVRFTISYFFK